MTTVRLPVCRERLPPLGHERGVVPLVDVDPPAQLAVLADLRPAAPIGLAAVVVADPRELDAVALEAAVEPALDGDRSKRAGNPRLRFTASAREGRRPS